MVKDFGEKGRGLVASRDFNVGDLILDDTSVISEFQRWNVELWKDLRRQVTQLSINDHADFFNLTESEIYRSQIEQRNKHINMRWKKALTIFLSNRIPGDGGQNHLFLNLSLVNHCCDPNSMWCEVTSQENTMARLAVSCLEGFNSLPHEKEGCAMELRAIREIKKGEEITASYLTFEEDALILKEKEARELKLEGSDGFKCKCSFCLQPEEDRSQLREEYSELLRMKTMMGGNYNTLRHQGQQERRDLQQTIEIQEKIVEFIIKLDNPFAYFSMWGTLSDLVSNCIVWKSKDCPTWSRHYDIVSKYIEMLKVMAEKGKFRDVLRIYNRYKNRIEGSEEKNQGLENEQNTFLSKRRKMSLKEEDLEEKAETEEASISSDLPLSPTQTAVIQADNSSTAAESKVSSQASAANVKGKNNKVETKQPAQPEPEPEPEVKNQPKPSSKGRRRGKKKVASKPEVEPEPEKKPESEVKNLPEPQARKVRGKAKNKAASKPESGVKPQPQAPKRKNSSGEKGNFPEGELPDESVIHFISQIINEIVHESVRIEDVEREAEKKDQAGEDDVSAPPQEHLSRRMKKNRAKKAAKSNTKKMDTSDQTCDDNVNTEREVSVRNNEKIINITNESNETVTYNMNDTNLHCGDTSSDTELKKAFNYDEIVNFLGTSWSNVKDNPDPNLVRFRIEEYKTSRTGA